MGQNQQPAVLLPPTCCAWQHCCQLEVSVVGTHMGDLQVHVVQQFSVPFAVFGGCNDYATP